MNIEKTLKGARIGYQLAGPKGAVGAAGVMVLADLVTDKLKQNQQESYVEITRKATVEVTRIKWDSETTYTREEIEAMYAEELAAFHADRIARRRTKAIKGSA